METKHSSERSPDMDTNFAATIKEKKHHFHFQTIFYVFVMCSGTISYAYSAGVIGNLIAQPSFYSYMKLTPQNTAPLIGAISSLYYVGGVFGAIAGHVVADRYGRKASMLLGSIVLTIATALCAGSTHIAMFIVFRCVSGFGALMVAMIVPLWITECVAPEVRGAFAQCHGVSISLGYMISSYVGVGFFLHVDPTSLAVWRGQAAIGIVPIICLLVGLYWIPESPRYLLMKGRDKEAHDIICKLHGTADDTRFAEMEAFQMKKQIEFDRTLHSTWKEMFRRPSLRKRVFLTVLLVFSVLSTGNLIIVLYGTILFANLGFDPEKQQQLQAGELAAVVPGLVAAIFFTEKFRRNRMVAFGLAISAVILACFTAVTAIFLDKPDNRSGQVAGVVLLYLYLVLTAAFLEGPNAYYSAEFYPTHLRAKGQTVNIVTYCVVSILWTQAASSAIADIGWKFFLVFISITAITTPIMWFYFPNTQGKTLEEIALLFGDADMVVVRQEVIYVDAESHTVRAKTDRDVDAGVAQELENAEEV